MIPVRVGADFSVDLPSTPTTGYRWQPVDLPGVRLLDTGFTSAGTAPGEGGTQHFRLRALRPGRHALTFELKRAWEADAADTTTVEIDVT
jgi:predicted secreted protein